MAEAGRPRVATVILAAGAGRRLGGVAKALLRDRHGRTFLALVAAAARTVGSELVCVVAAPHRARTETEAGRLGIPVVVNPAPERGMSSSVACGFAYAQARFEAAAALLWPVDHPRVRADTLRRLAAAADPARVVIPAFEGRGGHPPAIGRSLWPALAGCAALPEGARSVLRAEPGRVDRIDVDDIGVIADVDTRADLP